MVTKFSSEEICQSELPAVVINWADRGPAWLATQSRQADPNSWFRRIMRCDPERSPHICARATLRADRFGDSRDGRTGRLERALEHFQAPTLTFSGSPGAGMRFWAVLPYLAAYRTLKPDLDFGFARRPSRPVAYQSLSFCDASHVCAWCFLCGDWRGL